MASNKKPVLVYWDIRALAEPIRLLLRYLEVDFEDKRLPLGEPGEPTMGEAWFSQKHNLGLDFPNIPHYIDEDVKITQSMAILQHIGRKYNLCGDTLKEKAIIDMVAQTVNDLRWQAWLAYNAPSFPDIKEDWKKTIPTRLELVSKFLKGKEFVLGSKISYVDFLVYESMQWFRSFAPDVFQQSPELADLESFQKRIEALPQIKEYMKSENFKDWPYFAAFTYFGYSKDEDFKPIPVSYRNLFAGYPLDK